MLQGSGYRALYAESQAQPTDMELQSLTIGEAVRGGDGLSGGEEDGDVTQEGILRAVEGRRTGGILCVSSSSVKVDPFSDYFSSILALF